MFQEYNSPNTLLLGTFTDTGSVPQGTPRSVSLPNKGDMISSGNRFWRNPPEFANVGSNWFQRKLETVVSPTPHVNITRSNGGFPNQLTYSGQLVASGVNLAYTSVATGDSWGATAFNRMKPTKPDFSGLNAIFELRDLPGMLRAEILHRGLKAVSDYWLAYQFGWRPLLNDIVSLVKIQSSLQGRLAQLVRDNGKPVRRKVKLLSNSDVSSSGWVLSYSALQPTFVTQFYASQPSYQRITRTNDEVWASARFRYHLPTAPDGVIIESKIRRRLYGLYVSPAFVWNALPWSWLIDWFSNVGDVLENLDAGVADRLAADYIYVMRRKSYIVETTARGEFFENSLYKPRKTVHATTTDSMTSQSRVRGTPFGFGVQQGDLSNMQVSILGALGYSRLG